MSQVSTKDKKVSLYFHAFCVATFQNADVALREWDALPTVINFKVGSLTMSAFKTDLTFWVD